MQIGQVATGQQAAFSCETVTQFPRPDLGRCPGNQRRPRPLFARPTALGDRPEERPVRPGALRVTAFCLLHGAWHDQSCWDRTAEQLEALGHSAIAPELPLHDPAAGYRERVRPAVEAVEEVQGPLVVVAHSQSSGFGPLVAAARPVSLLVYLCPRLGTVEPPPGAPDPFRAGFPFPPDRPDGTKVWEPQAAMEAMYPRLAPATAEALAQRLRPMAMPADDYPLAEHPRVPIAFVYAAHDEFFEPDFERFMAQELGVEPIELPGGHFPMIEDPEGLAELLDRLAREHRPGR